MKGEGKAADILPIVGEVAEAAAIAKSVPELVAALEPLRKIGAYVSLLVSDGVGKAKSYDVEKAGEAEVSLAGSAAEGTMGNGKPYVEGHITKYSSFYDEKRLAGEGYGAYACLPLKSGNGVAGALCIARKGEEFRQQDMAHLSLASGIVGIALSRILLEQKVGNSEAIAQALLSKAAEVVFTADVRSGQVMGANSGAEAASGYSVAELLNMRVSALFDGLDPAAPKDGLLTLRRKRGGERFVKARCSIAEVGGRKLLILTGEDITEKAAEETNYREIVESIPDIIFALDSSGIITSINDEVEKVLGRGKQSLIGAPLGNIVSEADYKALGDAIQDMRLGAGTLHGLALRLLTKDGAQHWFELNGRAHYDPKGRMLKITGVLRDVHDMRRTAENKQLINCIMSNPNIAVLTTDTVGRVQFMNKGAEELFGYSWMELIGRDVRELYPEEKKGELDVLIRMLNEKGKTGGFETERVKKGGERIPVAISASTVINEGRVDSYLEVINDLSEQEELTKVTKKAREFEEKASAFKELADAKSVFVSSVSHELRTPLTNIHGYSALLSEGVAGKLNEEQMEYVNIIHSETDRLTKLINDLLDLSRMERGKFRLNPTFFRLQDLVEKCSCSAMAERKGLYVNWEIPPDLPELYGDPSRIAQVLINLISNAIKFTEAGGVSVTVLQKSKTLVQIDVADTGPGISQDDQKKLFRPFSQIPRADGQKKEGTGLGLAISKEITKLHNGKIWVESEPGKGAKFSIILRTTPKKERAKKVEAAQPSPAQPATGQAPAETPAVDQLAGQQALVLEQPAVEEPAPNP